eukprot:493866-Amphidinium_carterae.1
MSAVELEQDIALGKGGGHTSLRTYGMKRGPGCNYFCKETGVTKALFALGPGTVVGLLALLVAIGCLTTKLASRLHFSLLVFVLKLLRLAIPPDT